MDTPPGDEAEAPGGHPQPVDPAQPRGEDGSGVDAQADDDPGDSGPLEHEPPEGSDPLRFNSWMKRSATGAVLTGISLGLREALELKKNEPAIMIEASGEPEDPDNPIQLHFDPDDPRGTVAVIRMPSDPPGSRPTGPEQAPGPTGPSQTRPRPTEPGPTEPEP